MSLRVLHISDLHVAPAKQSDCAALVGAMLKDARAFAAERPFDLAIFSGDLVGAGQTDEFPIAQRILLDPLAEELNIPADRIFIAPGNHDVDRGQIRLMIESGLRDQLVSREAVDRFVSEPAEVEEATSRIAEWAKFIDSNGYGTVDVVDAFCGVRELAVGDRKIGLVVLNSAWRCSGDNDKGNLLACASSAEVGLEKVGECDARLVVMHHPLEWLQSFDADQLRTSLEAHGAVVFSGHMHTSDPAAHRSPRGEAIYLQAGCLYSSREYPNAYFVVDIDTADRAVKVHVRRWSENTRRFDLGTELAAGGETEFSLPQGSGQSDLGHPRFSAVKQMIADAAGELRVLPDTTNLAKPRPRSVEEMLIEPRHLAVPFKEARAAATIADGITRHEVEATRELMEGKVVVVAGEPQAGVSSSLHWILSTAYERDATKMPAYLRLRDSHLGRSRESASLRKAASSFGYNRSEIPDLMLAVDDVGAAGNKLERLIGFIEKHPQHRYIVGCRTEEAAAVSQALNDFGVSHAMAYVAPFGKTQLRELASSVSGGSDADVDRIYGLIQSQSLPQTPFMMIALITVVAGGLVDSEDVNESSLLEAYVNYLLGGSEWGDAEHLEMNYRKRSALLGELAYTLDQSPTGLLPALEVEEMFLTFFKKRQLRIPPMRVLGSLIDRRVLATDGQQVGFRHPALQDFFLGMWMLEEDANKATVLQNPLRNADAIRHAAAKERSDVDLLEQVGQFARGVISGVAERLPREKVDETLEAFEAIDVWDGEHFDKTMSRLPERRTPKELDAELDRWSEAIDLGLEGNGRPADRRPALSAARDLEQATMLLSDVLRSSDLVVNPKLKQELFELATEGWILLIGVSTAEDRREGPVRAMLEEIIEKLIPGDDNEELRELMTEFMLLLMTLVIAVIAQAKLGAKSLADTIEACLDNDEFAKSMTGRCLAVWAEGNLQMPEWPERLSDLLESLPSDTYLRNATVALAISHYRSSDQPIGGDSFLDRIVPHLVADRDPKERKIRINAVKQALKNSRLVYQGGLASGRSQPIPALLDAGDQP